MLTTNHLLFKILSILMLLCVCFTIQAQDRTLYGKILNETDIEGIHILNITSNRYTISDGSGAFQLRVNVQDSLIISSVKYIPETIKVTREIYEEGTVLLELRELKNELDEVLLGPNLTGNIKLDIETIPVVDSLDFYDVGIPGFKGIPQERIVATWDIRRPLAVDLEAWYKHWSGYYKTLQTKRKWVAQHASIKEIIKHYTPTFFEEAYQLPEEKLEDFILFCIETSSIQRDFKKGKHSLVMEVFKIKAPIYVDRILEKKE